MRARTIAPFLLWLVGPILAVGLTGGQSRHVDDTALKGAGRTAEDWLTYGLTQGETR